MISSRKGKPQATEGHKATGFPKTEIAELPKEDKFTTVVEVVV